MNISIFNLKIIKNTPNNSNGYFAKKGFTLIELIVVIAIIGLLMSVITTSLGKSRSKAEIAKFQTDYKSISNALELYRQSNGKYPGDGVSAKAITDLASEDLGSYMKQAPSISPAVVDTASAFPDVYYYLNPEDTASRYWCGDTASTQDYVIYFKATQEALDSGFFPELLNQDGSQIGLFNCISVNQN